MAKVEWTSESMVMLGSEAVKRDMEEALYARIKAKTAMDKAKGLEREAKDDLLGLFVIHELQKLKCNLGSLSYSTTTRETINKDLLVQAMADEGVDVALINKIVKKATKTSTSEGVTFRAAKTKA
jgi:hypothetical protein